MRSGVLATMVCVGLAIGGSAALADDIDVSTKTDAVVVFPSGAEVTRTGKVAVKDGTHMLVLDNLPAGVDPNSIRVEGQSTGGEVAIGSVDSRSRFVSEDDSADRAPERKQIEEQIRQLEDERQIIAGEIDAADAQGDLLRNLVALPAKAAGKASGESQPVLKADDWTQFVALVGTGLRDVKKAVVEARQRQREVDRKLRELRARLNELAPKQRKITEVKVNVVANGDADLDLVVRYQVPNASWTPMYDARLTTGEKLSAASLALTRRAIVTQRSGEDWKDVAVSLSTSKPSSGSAAPSLRPLVVDYKPTPKPAPVARPAAGLSSMRKQYRSPAAPQNEAMADAIVSGVDRRIRAAPVKQVAARIVNAPFQAIFEVSGRTDIPTTGEARRLRISSDDLKPELEVKTVPSRDAKAYLYARMTLGSGAPALAGPVSLFRDGVFVGTGNLPVLAGGEEHELGFGVDDLVRVKHAIAKDQRGESGLISTSRTDSRRYKVTLKNLHTSPVNVTVLDRMPVSKDQDIQVERTGLAPTKTDVDGKRGVVAWTQGLKAGEEKVIDFGYRVVWPSGKEVIYR